MCSGVFLQTRSFRKFGFIGGLLLLMLCGTWQQVFAQSQDDFTVFFFSDNQFAEEHGFSIAEQARVVDRFLIPVARRPAVLNMFSLSVLNKVIELGSPNVLNARMFIHLGDAINNGCKSEFASFLKVMNQESRDVRMRGVAVPRRGGLARIHEFPVNACIVRHRLELQKQTRNGHTVRLINSPFWK